jgi:fluoride exporter
MNMMALMYVAVGGAIGSMGRYAFSSFISSYNGTPFPYGTFVVNIAGSFLLGVWIAIMAAIGPEKSRDLHLLFAVGVLGGFTTFSTFTLDAFLLFERGLILQGLCYVMGSVMLSVLALFAAMWSVSKWTL